MLAATVKHGLQRYETALESSGPQTLQVLSQLVEDNRALSAVTMVADGVVALTVANFKEGNIIFEAVVRGHEELTMDDIVDLYDLREDKEREERVAKLLTKARQERLSILDISSSYGATCLLLAHSIKVIDQNAWSARYLSRATQPT